MMINYWVQTIRVSGNDWDLFLAVSPKGLIMSGIGRKEDHITLLQSLIASCLSGYGLIEDKEHLADIIRQFQEYFRGERRDFIFPLHRIGTHFQRKVWDALLEIPYGETRSYSDIAERIGSPKGQRAVGSANNKNPLGIVVPCHRVIGKNGNLIGYAGGLGIKTMLLELESGRTR